jgi:mannose-6-phosphate isomerase-like protein (cupin superfamily)
MQEDKRNTESNLFIGNPLNSDNVSKFLDGSNRSATMLRSARIGFGTYHVGWKWSLHAKPQTGKSSENHIGYILSGRMVVRDSAGIEREIGPGQAFEVGPGHDAWVIGNESCIALDFTNVV